jgi:LysR family nitrogen assimilation transcriptional regulator
VELRQIRYFLHVAEDGSFSKAATRLAVAQSALSRQISLLEQELGQRLLDRNGRGAVPTEAGRRMLDHCHTILQQVESARHDLAAMRDAPSGAIAIGMPPSAGRVLIMPLVDAFRHALPQATISVVEGLSADLIERLLTGRIALALAYEPTPSSTLRIVPLARQELFLIGAAAPLAKAKSTSRQRAMPKSARAVPFDMLGSIPLIIPGRTHAVRQHIEAELIKAGIAINVMCEVDGIPALLEMVAQGIGHAILPLDAIPPRDLDRFALSPIASPGLSIGLSAIVLANRPLSALTQATLKLIEQVVPKTLRNGPKI